MSLENEIKEMEALGFDVLATDSTGQIKHNTKANFDSKVCDTCKFLMILPDPDPTDWFCDDDVKAFCLKYNQCLERSLRPYEVKNIIKPGWCKI